jgi:hypothetical protein
MREHIMRGLLICLLPLLAACDATTAPGDAITVTEGAMPDITVEGEAATFALRPGLTLPATRDIVWNGKVFTFRWLANAGEYPYPPPPPIPDMPMPPMEDVYPAIALVGGTEDPREAFVVKEIGCFGGFDPGTGLTIGMPPRYAATGEWVFDVGSSCDG